MQLTTNTSRITRRVLVSFRPSSEHPPPLPLVPPFDTDTFWIFHLENWIANCHYKWGGVATSLWQTGANSIKAINLRKGVIQTKTTLGEGPERSDCLALAPQFCGRWAAAPSGRAQAADGTRHPGQGVALRLGGGGGQLA